MGQKVSTRSYENYGPSATTQTQYNSRLEFSKFKGQLGVPLNNIGTSHRAYVGRGTSNYPVRNSLMKLCTKVTDRKNNPGKSFPTGSRTCRSQR